MDIGLMHVTPYSKADPAIVASHAEKLGFESYWVGDHTIVPVESSIPYPGTKHDGREPYYVSQLPDPLIALARAGATTSRIKLGTGICLVPERNPLLTAKQVATLDDACGGRFLFGIGAGWNREESTILGGDFDHRWSQVKDYIAAMKVLWQEEISEYHGRYVDFPPVRCFPKPAQKPHPPILIGSVSSPHALKRVAEWGDGWLPVVSTVDQFAQGVKRIKEMAKEAGRDQDGFDFTVFALEPQWRTKPELQALERVGANRVVLWILSPDLKSILKETEELARTVLGEWTFGQRTRSGRLGRAAVQSAVCESHMCYPIRADRLYRSNVRCEGQMSADSNKATFLRFVEQLRKGNLEIIDEVCSPTFAFHSPNYPDWPRGLDGARQLVTLGRSLYKDAQTSIEDILAEGDKVAVRWTIKATYNGASRAGFPNPGECVTVGSMSMYRFVDGKIEDDWGVEVFWPAGIGPSFSMKKWREAFSATHRAFPKSRSISTGDRFAR